jgi:hypothetical protein
MNSRTPTLASWFASGAEALKGEIRSAMPGRVESYDSATQRANVLPLLRGRRQNPDGSVAAFSRPVVNSVPVLMPQGAGFQIKLPITKGDVVLIVFCDRSLDIWKSKGGEVDPVDLRQHHLSDAVAIPCLRDPAAAVPTSKIEIQSDGTVLLGGSAASHPLIFGDDFSSSSGAFNALLQAIATAVGTSGSPAGATAAAASIVAAIAAYQASVVSKLSTATKTA